MPSTATTRNRLEKQAPGENEDTWGERFNDNFADLLDAALDGMEAFTLSGSKTLTDEDFQPDEARKRVLNITGGTGGTITIPNLEKVYLIRNGSTGKLTITTGSGTSAYIAAGAVEWVFCNGSDAVYRAYQRRVPRFTSTDTTITPADDGGVVRSTSSAQRDFTIATEATSAWADGARIEVYGAGSGAIRIMGTGITLTWAGSTGTRTIAAGGRGVLERNGSNDWFLSGSGIT